MIQAYINGVPYAMTRNFSISEQLGNKTTSSIEIEVASGQSIPVAGDVIEIKDGSESLFWGLCGIPRSPVYNTGLERRLYSINCTNANALLGNRICNEAYQDTTLSAIIQDLFEKYISAEGIALGQISDMQDATVEAYVFKDENLQSAINELADLVGAVWTITSDRQFFFLKVDDFPAFAQPISQSFLLGTGLQHTTKDYKTRTVQYVSGAVEYTSQQTESFTYSADQASFVVSYPLAQKPAISVNGTALAPAQVGVNGLDNDKPGVAFLFSYNSTTINYKSTSELLAAGDTVSVTYTGMFPIRTASRNSSKISELAAKTGTSGLRERVEIVSDVQTAAAAYQLADSLLTQFADVSGEVKLSLLSSQLYALGFTLADVAPMTQISFDLPQLGITGQYVISERRFTPAAANMSDSADKWRIDLVLKDRDSLKTYGETLKSLFRSVSRLSARADQVIVDQQFFEETLALREQTMLGRGWSLFCASSVTNGALFAPINFAGDTYYPGG